LSNVGKVLLLAKQTQVHAEKTRGAGIEVTQNYAKKHEMPPVTFVGSQPVQDPCRLVFECCRCSWNRSSWRSDM